jgi:putative transposase
MSDSLMDRRCFRTFNVIDDYNREALHVEIDVSLTAQRITRILDQILVISGAPDRLRVDHGTEFTSAAVVAWCEQRSIVIEYTQPKKPTHNAFIERFNGIYRDGVLDAWCFVSLNQLREESERWLRKYNSVRPHESLGDISQIEFLTNRHHAEISSYRSP